MHKLTYIFYFFFICTIKSNYYYIAKWWIFQLFTNSYFCFKKNIIVLLFCILYTKVFWIITLNYNISFIFISSSSSVLLVLIFEMFFHLLYNHQYLVMYLLQLLQLMLHLENDALLLSFEFLLKYLYFQF